MYSFKSDYSEGCHPRILKTMVSSNLLQSDGYGLDIYSQEAIKILKQRLNYENIDIHFISGGTQTNLLAIATFLRAHEAVLATYEGHIYADECGSIEATGHKVVPVHSDNGKISAAMIEKALIDHSDPFDVKIKLIYISNVSEVGTIYTKKELQELRTCCDKNDLLLFMDGARLGSALTSTINDVSFIDLCHFFDAFYIGGTKNGALFGEALVIVKDDLKPDFRYAYKQRGAMLAKGRLLGIQFYELFKDKLYLDLANHANKMAMIIKEAFLKNNYRLLYDSYSNLQFPIIPNHLLSKFSEKYYFNIIKKVDDNNTAVRFVTSWATTEEIVKELVNDISLIK
ncbi:MAG: aminotransferase class I/II-fold pyridoxal phosphate-dependent enzyme [Bacilli bacterium]|jgi:threonine aldolase|nr:aminotransferase class I/II-fold pyridoxal phosphate-dependent enzyme [Bacilli bacterium]